MSRLQLVIFGITLIIRGKEENCECTLGQRYEDITILTDQFPLFAWDKEAVPQCATSSWMN